MQIMVWIFEIRDKSGRKIHLSDERWNHIVNEHPEIASYVEQLKDLVENPTKITTYSLDENVKYYYKYFKERKSSAKYLLVIVKYLNDHGSMITAYFVINIK